MDSDSDPEIQSYGDESEDEHLGKSDSYERVKMVLAKTGRIYYVVSREG